MQEAAGSFVGKHDFASFQSHAEPDDDDNAAPDRTADTVGPAAIAHGDFTPPPWRRERPTGTVREVFAARLTRHNGVLKFEVQGAGFLRGMVRAMAGSLLEIGLGKQPPAWIAELLTARDRRQAGANLPGHGLTLVRVAYPPEPFEGRESYDGRFG